MKTEMVQFAGGVLEAGVDDKGVIWINLKRACEELGVDVEGQRQKLKNYTWASAEMISVEAAGQVGTREMTFVNSATLTAWLLTINASKVKEHLRDRLAKYQKEAVDVLSSHFFPRTMTAPAAMGLSSAMSTLRGMAAQMQTNQRVMDEIVMITTQLAESFMNHEERIRVIEAKPVISVEVKLNSRVGEMELLRKRFDAELKSMVLPITSNMSPQEKGRFFSNLNGDLKTYAGAERENWQLKHYAMACERARDVHGLNLMHVLSGLVT